MARINSDVLFTGAVDSIMKSHGLNPSPAGEAYPDYEAIRNPCRLELLRLCRIEHDDWVGFRTALHMFPDHIKICKLLSGENGTFYYRVMKARMESSSEKVS